MPMTITETELTAMVRSIVAEVRPEQIILFGSYARGDAGSDADVDLLVIEAEPFGPHRSRFQEINRLERAMGSIPVATDILVYSLDEVERLKSSRNHVVARALREGKVLHARS
jgi:predicted nucleotidyltransferase